LSTQLPSQLQIANYCLWGHVAEWLRNGLQNRVPRFNSGRGLHKINNLAAQRKVAEIRVSETSAKKETRREGQ
jgi:hypothetical protein